MKKIISVAVAAMMLTGAVFAAPKVKVGVSMPTKSLQRWNQDGSNMAKELKKAGYAVDLQYANNDIAMQTQQIENMLTKGDKILVIAAIDGSALKGVLDTAKKQGGDLIFLRKIVRGAADDSYGIEVAKLAGLPETVIRGAKKHLRKLEAAAPAPEIDALPDDDQISLVDVGADKVAERLRKLDLNTITPIEAMNLLAELQKTANA